MLMVLVVGIFTTFLSSEGFIGIRSSNQALVRDQSLKLLIATILATAAAYILKAYGTFVAVGIPFAVLTMYKEELAKKIS